MALLRETDPKERAEINKANKNNDQFLRQYHIVFNAAALINLSYLKRRVNLFFNFHSKKVIPLFKSCDKK